MELQPEVNQRAGKNKEKKRGEGERGGWSGVAGGRERKNIFLASSQIVNESRFNTHSKCPPGTDSAGSRRS